VDRTSGDPEPGGTVEIFSSEGDYLARGAYSPHSQIRARVWTFEDESVDEVFLQTRIQSALRARESWNLSANTDAYRLIYAESDSLPGLIVDRYGDVLVLQSLSTGIEHWKQSIVDILLEETGTRAIYERSDADVRDLEGLVSHVGMLVGDIPEPELSIHENNLRFKVDISTGHKTGFYLDQRSNRKCVRELSVEREVLDCFCYTGGFSLNALAGGARSVVSVDSSAAAIALGIKNLAINELVSHNAEWIEGDVFQVLRKLRDEGRSFDMIILDPPKFAPTRSHAEKAARGYKDINRLAFLLLRDGGLLVSFSCSGGVDAPLFRKIIASAALDAGAEAQIVHELTQGPDHPVSLHFPEGAYLKGLVCLVR
jgi:23S rRNA (cytosine1962-C5)-methyltransferase